MRTYVVILPAAFAFSVLSAGTARAEFSVETIPKTANPAAWMPPYTPVSPETIRDIQAVVRSPAFQNDPFIDRSLSTILQFDPRSLFARCLIGGMNIPHELHRQVALAEHNREKGNLSQHIFRNLAHQIAEAQQTVTEKMKAATRQGAEQTAKALANGQIDAGQAAQMARNLELAAFYGKDAAAEALPLWEMAAAKNEEQARSIAAHFLITLPNSPNRTDATFAQQGSPKRPDWPKLQKGPVGNPFRSALETAVRRAGFDHPPAGLSQRALAIHRNLTFRFIQFMEGKIRNSYEGKHGKILRAIQNIRIDDSKLTASGEPQYIAKEKAIFIGRAHLGRLDTLRQLVMSMTEVIDAYSDPIQKSWFWSTIYPALVWDSFSYRKKESIYGAEHDFLKYIGKTAGDMSDIHILRAAEASPRPMKDSFEDNFTRASLFDRSAFSKNKFDQNPDLVREQRKEYWGKALIFSEIGILLLATFYFLRTIIYALIATQPH